VNETRIRQLYQLAREKPPAERRAFVARMCDGELLERVLALLAADEGAGASGVSGAELTAAPAPDPVPSPGLSPDAGESEGEVIGHYKLLQQIGEGGMGTVWMAEQFEPVRRKVALKVVKLGMDTRQVVARFEAERQALALMDHPNIAKVLDGGVTGGGRPYFVMELVKGIPITEFCDEAKFGIRDRLRLFADVCAAVQHAHQKGVIHRDLKPSNVLVTLHDGKTVPKVIDFGIAKATNQELTQKTLFTEYRQILGTPEYMAPEQAAMSGLDVDTRADVYSLGVLLYELLTGTKPFDLRTLMGQGYDEILRTIREVDPPRPSTRASTIRDDTRRISMARQLGEGQLGRALRGELDWIVVKAMEKDRARRYESANGLADDIRRFLADEPVAACPPSAAYRLRKFARRNRGVVTALAIVGAILVTGAAGTSWGLVRALGEQDRAERAERVATEDQRRAEAAEEKAKGELARAEVAEASTRRELARAEEVKRIVIGMIKGVTPEEAEGLDTTLLRAVIDRTADRIANGDVKDPRIAAELHSVLGFAYRAADDLERAEVHTRKSIEIREREFGPDHKTAIGERASLGALLAWRGDLEKGAEMLARERDRMIRLAGPEDPQVISQQLNLSAIYLKMRRARDGEKLARETWQLARRVLGESADDTLAAAANTASALLDLGRTEEALEIVRHVRDMYARTHGAEDARTLNAARSVALVLGRLNRNDEALEILRAIVPAARKAYGPTHKSAIWTHVDLFQLLVRLRRVPDAGAELEQIAPLVEANLPAADEVTLRFRRIEAEWHIVQRHPERAIAILRESAAAVRSRFGNDSPTTLTFLMRAGSTLLLAQQFAEAREYLALVAERADRVWGPDNLFTLSTLLYLARAEGGLGRAKDAEPRIRDVIRRRTVLFGSDADQTLDAVHDLARNLAAQSRLDDADALYRALLDRMRKPSHAKILVIAELAAAKESARRLEEAESLRRRQLEVVLEVYGPRQMYAYDTRMRIAVLRKQLGHYDEAAELLRVLVADVRASHGEDERLLYAWMGEQAMALGAARRFDEAAAILRKARAGALERWGEEDPVVKRLVELQAVLDADLARFGKGDGSR